MELLNAVEEFDSMFPNRKNYCLITKNKASGVFGILFTSERLEQNGSPECFYANILLDTTTEAYDPSVINYEVVTTMEEMRKYKNKKEILYRNFRDVI